MFCFSSNKLFMSKIFFDIWRFYLKNDYQILWKIYFIIRINFTYRIIKENKSCRYIKFSSFLLSKTYLLIPSYFIKNLCIIIYKNLYDFKLLWMKLARLHRLKTYFWVIYLSICYMSKSWYFKYCRNIYYWVCKLPIICWLVNIFNLTKIVFIFSLWYLPWSGCLLPNSLEGKGLQLREWWLSVHCKINM